MDRQADRQTDRLTVIQTNESIGNYTFIGDNPYIVSAVFYFNFKIKSFRRKQLEFCWYADQRELIKDSPKAKFVYFANTERLSKQIL